MELINLESDEKLKDELVKQQALHITSNIKNGFRTKKHEFLG